MPNRSSLLPVAPVFDGDATIAAVAAMTTIRVGQR